MPTSYIKADNPEFASKQRRAMFRLLVLMLGAIFVLRLGYMQIVEGGTYLSESESQAIKQVVVEPFRGDIYDRNGEIIVNNEPSFTLTITKNDFNHNSLVLLSTILQVDTTEIVDALKPYKNVSKFTPIRIFRDLDFASYATIEEYSDLLPGVDIIVDSKRRYNFNGNMAHLLGYTREISDKQLKEKSYYRSGDIVGKTGIEAYYENILCGAKGIKFVTINKFGKKVSSFDNGKNDIPGKNGFDLYLSIDKKLQDYAETLLQGKRGALVAIDPNNGEVIALASKPDYNPRDFSGKIPPGLFTKLNNDPASPMYNRAIMSPYAPGSTWKMLIALAALQEGIINQNTTFVCRGSLTIGSRPFKCHGGHAHGAMNLISAIKASCNVYFYNVAMMLGMEKLQKYAEMFGFGYKTFIDLPNESRGRFPYEDWVQKKFGANAKVPAGYLANFGIGQGEISATPLQMAVYCATLANKGTVYQPHVVRYIHNNITNKKELNSYDSRKLNIRQEYFDLVQRGMYEVVNVAGGTANNAQIAGISVCGKTGTAQNPHGRDHSWFICFAPRENPKIAICVFVENAGFGSDVAAPIARAFMNAFFYPNSFTMPSMPSTTFTLDSLEKLIQASD